jgi:6-phosphogluconate dehydrogenase
MQIGMIGLGRMGANMVRRLLRGGHDCGVHAVSAAAIQTLVREGATGAISFDVFVEQVVRPRVVWLMVPAGVVDATLERFSSRGEADFQDRVPSAMRREFGGHVEKTR